MVKMELQDREQEMLRERSTLVNNLVTTEEDYVRELKLLKKVLYSGLIQDAYW